MSAKSSIGGALAAAHAVTGPVLPCANEAPAGSGSLSSRVVAGMKALVASRAGVPADLSSAQIHDAGIPAEAAGRGRAADVDAATIANLTALR